MTFKAGEIVRVKSGGPELTVLGEEEGKVLCLFFSEELGEFREATLPLVAVETVDAAGDGEDPNEDEEEDEDGEDEDADEEDEEKPNAKKQRVAA